MLSRVAERIYWMARYLERAENTARIVNVNTNLLLDLPILEAEATLPLPVTTIHMGIWTHTLEVEES